jgi:hypothetical protein
MLQWRLPTDITPEQAGILENKIYPKLSSAILSVKQLIFFITKQFIYPTLTNV